MLDSREVRLFRSTVEGFFNIFPETKEDYTRLTTRINKSLKDRDCMDVSDKQYETVSESSVLRIWQYVKTDKDFNPIKTLARIARSIGYSGWRDFVEKNKLRLERVADLKNTSIYIDRLQPGEVFYLGWPLEKYSKLKYLGELKFEVLESQGTKKPIGFTFDAP